MQSYHKFPSSHTSLLTKHIVPHQTGTTQIMPVIKFPNRIHLRRKKVGIDDISIKYRIESVLSIHVT